MKCSCIIVGVDFSAQTEAVLAYAAYFSEKSGNDLMLFYVLDYLLTPPAYIAAYMDEEKKREESEMAKWKAVLEESGLKVDTKILSGRLHESFLRVINDFLPELLVIGYRSHAIRPSSSEMLIRSIVKPMLVVRGEKCTSLTIGTVDVKKILCAVDLSAQSLKALDVARRYAELFGAELKLIHVITSHVIKQRFSSDKKSIDMLEAELLEKSESALSDILLSRGLAAVYDIVFGDPVGSICSTAYEGRYDLVVVGARGLNPIEGILVGSTTEGVLKSSPCPVLIVH